MTAVVSFVNVDARRSLPPMTDHVPSPDFVALGGWPAILGRVMSGGHLSTPSAATALGEILAGGATPAQVAAFIVALRVKGETVDEMVGMVEAMTVASERVVLSPDLVVIDTCGTGGAAPRREAALNISTIAALVVAGAGVAVCKHGNRAASSTSGSADLLEALGVAIDLGPVGVARCVTEAGMGFCLAPRFHPGMRFVGPVRRELGVPTVFNVLGPLANPARLRRQVIGVADPRMAERMIGVLAARGAERSMVVSGHDGLDELTITTTSTIHELRDGELRTYDLDPVSLGIALVEAEALRGGDPARNAELAQRVLAGEPGAHREVVLLNAAAGLVVGGAADDLATAYNKAAGSIDDGAAAAVLARLIAVSQEARENEAKAAEA